MIKLTGAEIELYEAGHGKPLLYLHGPEGFATGDAFVPLLAARRHLLAPWHPGFGRSELPDWLDTPDDIAYLYLELLDRLGLQTVDIVGASLGGWIAAEMATKEPQRVSKLVLVAPVGVKTGPVEMLDIPDIFAMPQSNVNQLLFHNPEKFRFDPSQHSDEELTSFVRSRETLALLVWEPWMHNPKLKHRLARATMPTLFLRGQSDGLVSADYLERYAALLQQARIETIAEAGHALPVEQPEAFAEHVLRFLDAEEERAA
ncbi:MAG: alpha/beta hydrolase [Chloroflexi bacterium]|nr:alpha/beta hydrolase [Chloroflexota bacterium]MBV9599326.1 alpha/beta hydrolase [Chloroflexota bacterium]